MAHLEPTPDNGHPAIGSAHGGNKQPTGVDLDAVMEQVRAEVAQRGPPAQLAASPARHSGQDVESPSQPPLSAEEVMARVRAEVARRRAANNHVGGQIESAPAPAVTSEERLPRWQPAALRLPDKPEYVLADFLRFNDADFINVAYQTLLRRPADSEGRKGYLDALRAGSTSKVEILGLIRFSEEGMKLGVHVDGLLLPFKLHQWRHRRVIGWFIGFAMALFRLPRLALRLQGMEASAAHEAHEIGRLLDRIDAAVEKHFAGVDGTVNSLRSELKQSVMARVEEQRAIDARVGKLQVVVESIDDALRASDAERVEQHRALQERLAVHESVSSALEQSLRASDAERLQQHEGTLNRLVVHDAALAKLSEQARSDQRSLRGVLERLTVFLDVSARRSRDGRRKKSEAAEPALESQYASFEDAFRGDRGEIKQRASHYLGTLAAAGIEPGGDAVVLDLGSGRGEWLEVLTENGYACRGVDLDRGMLKASQDRGHGVVEADALDYLRAQEDGSFSAVTSMHLVEHIPHPVLLQLLDQAFRVLRPGGVLILETPNPENVLVGSCMFYMDPTHLNPIPPSLLQWVVKSRGFADPVIERLSEHRGKPDLAPVSDKVPGAAQINQIIEWFTAPPDYAVIARKPPTARPLGG